MLATILDSIVFKKTLNESTRSPLEQTLENKIIPLLFYACDEEHTQCASLIWSSMRKSLDQNEDVLSLVNVRKAFVPKLIALLKAHANGNANPHNVETVYVGLGAIVRRVLGRLRREQAGVEEELTFGKDLMTKLFDSVARPTVNAPRGTRSGTHDLTARSRKISAYFDCLHVFFTHITTSNEGAQKLCEFFHNLISNQVIVDYILKKKVEFSIIHLS